MTTAQVFKTRRTLPIQGDRKVAVELPSREGDTRRECHAVAAPCKHAITGCSVGNECELSVCTRKHGYIDVAFCRSGDIVGSAWGADFQAVEITQCQGAADVLVTEVELADADAVGQRHLITDDGCPGCGADGAATRGRVEVGADVGDGSHLVVAQFVLVNVARGVVQRGGIDKLHRAAVLRAGERGGDGGRAVVVGGAHSGRCGSIGVIALLVINGNLFAGSPGDVQDFLILAVCARGDGLGLGVFPLGGQGGCKLDGLGLGSKPGVLFRGGFYLIAGCEECARNEQDHCQDVIDLFHRCLVVKGSLLTGEGIVVGGVIAAAAAYAAALADYALCLEIDDDGGRGFIVYFFFFFHGMLFTTTYGIQI